MVFASSIRYGVQFAFALMAVVGLSNLGLAQISTERIHLDIPAQDLSSALTQFGRDAGTEVVFTPEAVRKRVSASIKGEFTREKAISLLLDGTGLTFRIGSQGAIVIVVPAVAGDRPNQTSLSGGLSDDTHIARAAAGQESVSSGGSQAGSDQAFAKQPGLEEIVVTAQKREERLQDIPISIVALTGADLAKRNITNIDDLSTVVPGLSVQDDGDVRRIALRGMANVFGNASLIGVYLDESDVTSTGSTQLPLDTYDLQRVEVLRGPQGTLYGEGSVGGTIRFITNSPDPSQFTFNSDVTALFTQAGTPSQRIQGAINVPLVDNLLALRVATQFDHEGGWINQPAANQRDINDQTIADVRTKVLWQPLEPLTVSAMAEIHRNNAGPSSGEDSSGNYTQAFNLTTTPRITEDYDLYNLTISYDTGWARLLNTSTYFNQSNDSYNREHYFQLTAPPSTPFEEYLPLSTENESSVNDELRLTSVGSGPWQWTLGTFYRGFKNSSGIPSYYFALPGPPGAPLPPSIGPYFVADQSKAWSIFGDTSYKLFDRLTIGAGVRSYWDHEYAYDPYQEAPFHSVDPRFYADLKLNNQVNLYLSAAKGFRSGGFNSAGSPTYGPESVWTYELGSKMSLMEHRLNIDADVFYSDYKNYIVAGVSPTDFTTGTIDQNAGDAVMKGVEWNLSWRPVDEWVFSVNGDYLDTYFTTVNLVPASAPVAVGDNVDFTPKYQGDVSAERDFRWNGKSAFSRLDYSLQGRETYRNRSIGPWYLSESNVIRMLNFNTGIQWNENLSLGVFAQNLLNDRGYTSPIVIETDAARARPRTYGVDFGVKF